jgi:membrane fusion protein, multidrug efflux system
MKRKAVISIFLIGILVAGGVAAYTNLRTQKPASAPAAPPAIPVVAETVKSGDVPIYLSGIGTVVAYNMVVIRSQITGQLTHIDFTQGQSVKKGDLLAQIDPRPYQAQLISTSQTATATRRSFKMLRLISADTNRLPPRALPQGNF